MRYRYSENVPALLARYPFRTDNVRLLSHKGKKAVWLAETDAGGRIVKKVPFSERDIEFMIDAIDHLRMNGLHTPAVVRTADGAGWAELDGERFVVFEAIDGRPPEYSRREELRAIMRSMAAFHNASRGFVPRGGYYPSLLLPKWETVKLSRLEQLARWEEEARAKKHPNEFDQLFLEYAEAIKAQCTDSVTEMRRAGFERWMSAAMRDKTLCHQDFAAGNLALSDNGRLYVLDMDSLTVDVPGRDIRKILNKVMKRDMSWDVERMLLMLKAYQEVNPLTEAQLRALSGELMFPHLSYGQVSKYYEGRESSWTEEKHLERLRAMIATDLSKEEALRAFRFRIGEVVSHGSGVGSARSRK